MARRRRFEVQPFAGRWRVMDGRRPVVVVATKAEAVQCGIASARSVAPSQLIIKRRNGTIEDERTYGSDPYPPRG